MIDFQTFYETSITGPMVGEDPGVLGTGSTGRDIYKTALDFIARHNKVMRSTVQPMFDRHEWLDAPVGTELDSTPKFLIDGTLVAKLQWVNDTRGKSGRVKGHWKLQSMYLNR